MQRNQELEWTIGAKEKEIHQMKQSIEQVESQNIDLQLELKNMNTANARISHSETELRNKLEQNKLRLSSQADSLRKIDEENYSLKSEIQNLQTDIVNMVNIEDSLRKELSVANYRKKELEDSISQMKSKICNDNISLRHIMTENEQSKREISHLKDNINLLNTENQDMKKEIELLKDKAFTLEKQNLYLTNNVGNREERINELTKEWERTKNLFNTQKEIARKNEISVK